MTTSEVLELDIIKEKLMNFSKMEINKERFKDLEMSNDKSSIEKM